MVIYTMQNVCLSCLKCIFWIYIFQRENQQTNTQNAPLISYGLVFISTPQEDNMLYLLPHFSIALRSTMQYNNS